MISPRPLFALALALFSPCILTPCARAAPDAPVRFYVAPGGSDAWSGALSRPNAAKNDGPFATITRARDAVRAAKPGRGALIEIAGGTYVLAAPLRFDARDSGTPAAPIVYAAAPGAHPVFSGGQTLGNWKIVGNRWETTLPEVRAGRWNFVQLWRNGERRERPRWPQNGYAFIDHEVAPSAFIKGQGYDGFGFKAGDVRADWHNRDDIEFLMFQTWTMARMKARAIDFDKREISFAGQTTTSARYGAFPKGNRYIVENVREALAPGQWYLDRASGVLTYWPKPGETPANSRIVAPRLESLVEFNGDQTPVANITLRGLSFEYSNWNTPPDGNHQGQAEIGLESAIRAHDARDILLENCDVSHLGAYAINFERGCHNNQIIGCRLQDLGAGGIKLGLPNLYNDARVDSDRALVRNCVIAHFGRLHPAGVGVWIGHSPFNIVDHNTIVDGYYTGISPGWSWGYPPSGAHDNAITNNRIAQIGQGVLSDMGGIYTLGISTNTLISGNVIHDVQSFDYGGWGLYFDEGTSGVTAEHNLIYRTKSAGFHQHYGENNVVRDNVFAWGEEAQLMRTRAEDHLSFQIENNIVVARDAPILGSDWSGSRANYQLNSNLYWDAGGAAPQFKGQTLEQWQAGGQDAGSVVADPLFVDAAHDNYALRPNSPALKIGFQPFDWSGAGARDSAGKVIAANSVAPAPRAFPVAPGPQPFVDDFENGAVGAKSSLTTNEENATATARLSDEQHSPFGAGRQSLKFVDEAGQRVSYDPHVYAQPKLRGALRGTLDVRWDEGASIYHEWRDGGQPYHAGPSFRVDGAGQLQASGKTLMQLQPQKWARFEIEYTTGTPTWNLTVTPDKGAPQRFDNLVCDTKMRELDWWGLVSDGQTPVAWYADNLSVGPVELIR